MSSPRHILAIDPGTTRSAWVWYGTEAARPSLRQGRPDLGIDDNGVVLKMLFGYGASSCTQRILAIEQVKYYGANINIGDSVLGTVLWSGRFIEAWGGPWVLIPRKTIVTHVTGNPRANDSNVIAALLDRFGGTMKAAKGTKAKPGPLYGIKSHIWQALAVAVTAAERSE